MLINSQTIGDVRQKIGTGGRFSTRFQRMVDELSTNWAALHTGNDVPYNAMALGMVAATIDPASSAAGSSGVPGINYQSRSKTDFSTRAIACLKAYKAVSTTFHNYAGAHMALAIDWTWAQMTSGERSSFSTWVQTVDNWSFNQHPADIINSQVAGVRAAELMAGIAFYGNGQIDSWASSKVANFPSRFHAPDGITGFDSFLAGHEDRMGGDPPEGWSYGFNYTHPQLWYGEEAYRTAMGGSLSTHYGSTAVTTLRMIPAKMAALMLPLEEASGSPPGGHYFAMFAPYRTQVRFTMANAEFQWSLGAAIGRYATVDSTTAEVGQWLATNRVGEPQSDNVVFVRYNVPYMLMGSSVAPTATSPADRYPLSYRVGESRVVFRTSWTDTNGGFVQIDTQKWAKGAISPKQSGGLVIHRKGPAVTKGAGDSGNIEFSGSLTGSASQMIFPDRSVTEKQAEYDDMGGTRQIHNTVVKSSTDFTNGSVKDAQSTIRMHVLGGVGVQYVGQDLTRSYDSTSTPDTDGANPTRIRNYWRHLVYFDPPSTADSIKVMVFDRTQTVSTAFVPTDMVRFSGLTVEAVAASTAAGPARNPSTVASSNYAGTVYHPGGGTQGLVTWSSVVTVTATQTAAGTNNKTIVTPVLPVSVQAIRVGGPSSNGSSWTTSDTAAAFSCEATDPYGVRYDPTLASDWSAYHSGSYRIELTNTNPSSIDVFLKTIEVGDSTLVPNTAARMNGGSFVGATLGTNAAFFNSTGETCSTGSLILESSGTYLTLIAGLTPSGSYTATRGANISDVTNLDGASTSLAWTASTAGTMRVRIVASAAGTGAGNTVGWS
jgi:hypothetical protein